MTAARLSGAVVLISGAGERHRRGHSARCIAEGAKVICADLRGEAARALADGLGAAALGIACDVADSARRRRPWRARGSISAGLTALVHNAAAPSPGRHRHRPRSPRPGTPRSTVGLTGAFFLASSPCRYGSRRRRVGRVDRLAVRARRRAKAVAYCAAKAGLVHLAKAMALDHAGSSIRVNSLSPGAVATSGCYADARISTPPTPRSARPIF